MHSIGAIAAVAADALGGVGSHLPWGWFTFLGMVDAALVAVLVRRRLRPRRPVGSAERQQQPDTLVLRSGWWVPRSRALGLPPLPGTYAWPLHREYLVHRLV